MICIMQHLAIAQSNSCEEQLNSAQAEFDAGRFYGIPAMLAPCIDKGFSREQRQRAFLLLTQAYLLLDDPIGADNSYLEVLRANPEFLADTARDQIDVVYLSKRFTAAPIFSLFGRIGGNLSPVEVIDVINASGEPNVKNDYKAKVGWQFGAGADWHINERIAVSAELNYMFTSYEKTQTRFNRDIERFKDNQNTLSIPIAVKYTIFTREEIRPYIFAGYAFNFLFSDRGQIQIIKADDGRDGILEESSPRIDFSDYRRKLNRAFFIGGGVKYKFGINFLFAEMRYNFGLTNVVSNSSTYDQDGPATEYGHVDDFFRLDNLSISVGYVKPLYKPRKVKRVKTKSVLKDIKKQSK